MDTIRHNSRFHSITCLVCHSIRLSLSYLYLIKWSYIENKRISRNIQFSSINLNFYSIFYETLRTIWEIENMCTGKFTILWNGILVIHKWKNKRIQFTKESKLNEKKTFYRKKIVEKKINKFPYFHIWIHNKTYKSKIVLSKKSFYLLQFHIFVEFC